MAIYSTAQFQVKDFSSFSARHSFLRGIRQGCPQSPYLFILVLSALMEDVTSSYRSQYGILHSVVTHGVPLTDIEYADDTLLLSRTAQSLNRFLHILQYQAALRGLLLNADKCHLLALYEAGLVQLLAHPVSHCNCPSCHPVPGDPLPELITIPSEDSAQYLGAMIMPNSSAAKDVQHRCFQALRASEPRTPSTGILLFR